MDTKHNITLFENNYGDSFIVKIYSKELDRYINLLFDMGKGVKGLFDTKEVEKLDGIFVSHVDCDHIAGVIKLLENDAFKRTNKLSFIVFNKFNDALISYSQGNRLSEEIKNQNIITVESYKGAYDALNTTLSNKIPLVFLSKSKRSLLPKIEMYKEKIFITFLLPDEERLRKLMYEWNRDNIKKGRGKTGVVTNRSSIVCLVEFTGSDEKISLLLTGDGYMSDVKSVLDNYKESWALDKIDCIKLSHHGSRENNEGIKALINEYRCRQLFYMSMKGVSVVDTLNEIPSDLKVIMGSQSSHEFEKTKDRLIIRSNFAIGENYDT